MKTHYYIGQYLRPKTNTTITQLYLDTNLDRLIKTARNYWKALGEDNWKATIVSVDRQTFENMLEKTPSK